MRHAARKKVKKDLLEQLERNGTCGEQYIDLVEDYMKMWDSKEVLQADIKFRGVNVKYDNGGGQIGIKKNDSIEQVLKVGKQMLTVLDYLDIKPSKQVGGDDGDDEM